MNEALETKWEVFDSLEQALRRTHARMENRPFIRELFSTQEITKVERRSAYIKVTVASQEKALHVFKGYTTGFESPEVITDAVGAIQVWQPEKRNGLWAVDHPNIVHRGESSSRQKLRSVRYEEEHKACPNCFILMARSGICTSCG